MLRIDFMTQPLGTNAAPDGLSDLLVGRTGPQEPTHIRLNGRDLDLSGLIRSLDVGQALFSSATSSANRLIVGNVRPRNVAHGGEAF